MQRGSALGISKGPGGLRRHKSYDGSHSPALLRRERFSDGAHGGTRSLDGSSPSSPLLASPILGAGSSPLARGAPGGSGSWGAQDLSMLPPAHGGARGGGGGGGCRDDDDDDEEDDDEIDFGEGLYEGMYDEQLDELRLAVARRNRARGGGGRVRDAGVSYTGPPLRYDRRIHTPRPLAPASASLPKLLPGIAQRCL